MNNLLLLDSLIKSENDKLIEKRVTNENPPQGRAEMVVSRQVFGAGTR